MEVKSGKLGEDQSSLGKHKKKTTLKRIALPIVIILFKLITQIFIDKADCFQRLNL